jgi:hypothetical protein
MGLVMSGFLIKILRGMLFHGSKKYLLYLFSILCVFSCEKSNTSNYSMQHTRDEYIRSSFIEYKEVYESANDTLHKWITDSLVVAKYITVTEWELDSVIIFNNDKTIFKTTINNVVASKNSISDCIYDFAGRKINDKWYFFFGSTLYLTRGNYQTSIDTPLSFDELSYLAYKNKFKYYVENKIPLPDDYLDPYFDLRGCPKGSRVEINTCLDSLVLKTNAEYYLNKFNAEEIIEIKNRKIDNVRPTDSSNNKKSWWQFGKAVPIFETEEWKDYLKQKYGSKWEEQL